MYTLREGRGRSESLPGARCTCVRTWIVACTSTVLTTEEKAMTTTGTTNRNKLSELVLYVAGRCERHEFFGTIKLNKILFYADMNAYKRTGATITGADYRKNLFGPEPVGIEPMIEQMRQNRDLEVVERPMPDLTTQERVLQLRTPDLSLFSAEEIATVNDVIDWVRSMSANAISDLTHDLPAWKAARMGEIMPPKALLVPSRPLPLTDREWTRAERIAARVVQQRAGS